jgi:hypothetical protein
MAMNKPTAKSKKNSAFAPRIKSRIPKGFGEKPLDTVPLRDDIAEDERESELSMNKKNTTNWSAAEDRGEDLINETDPFVQQPERDTQIPPELIQEHAYRLYEQRGGGHGDNLADWFEAERKLRGEVANRTKQNKRSGRS